jgi:hypothetical protein
MQKMAVLRDKQRGKRGGTAWMFRGIKWWYLVMNEGTNMLKGKR